jgi:hypothetical protein
MAYAHRGITSRETLNRLVSLRDELGATGHLISPVRTKEYREALWHCIRALNEIAGPPPRPRGNVVEFRPSG